MKVYLMLDVGGTNIKAGVLWEDGSLWKEGILSFDAKSRGSKEEVFLNFAGVLDALAETAQGRDTDRRDWNGFSRSLRLWTGNQSDAGAG